MANFWMNDARCLFANLEVFPTASQTPTEKLNALSRLVIVIAIVMYFMKVQWAIWFGFVGLAVIALIYQLFVKPACKERFYTHLISDNPDVVTQAPLDAPMVGAGPVVATAPLIATPMSLAGSVYEPVYNTPPEIVEPTGISASQADYRSAVPMGAYLQSLAHHQTSRLTQQANDLQAAGIAQILKHTYRWAHNGQNSEVGFQV